jgi:hypothetical protein
MSTITLQVEDSIMDKLLWFFNHFSKQELKVIDIDNDDTYLRSINGMVESIKEARKEPLEKGVTLDKLEW